MPLQGDTRSGPIHAAGRGFQVPPEALLDAMVVSDAQGVIVQTNTRAETLFGYGRDELLGRPVEILIPERFHQRHVRARRAYRDRPHVRMMDSDLRLWARHRDGREFPVAISLSPLDDGGATLALIRDISERLHLEAQLRETARRYRAIFDQTYEFIGLLTTDGTLLEVNRSALDWVGLKPVDVLGRPFWTIGRWWPTPESRTKLQNGLREAAAGKFVRFEFEHTRSDGQIRLVDFSLKPILDEVGRVVLILPEGRDITERKRAELALQQTQRQLQAVNRQLVRSLRILQEDEAAGQQLQFQMLPEASKTIGCYEFSRQLFTSTYLSGDFVDYFVIDEGHLGFYMADVSGHGVPSALVTVLLKSHMNRYLQHYHQEQDPSILEPQSLLERLNQDLLQARLDKYLTIFYGVLCTADNSLCYANGGQFPFPMLYDGSRAAFISCKSLPVGLFDFARYQSRELSLPPDFTLALLSDGVLELMPQQSLKDKEAALLSVLDAGAGIDELVQRLGLEPAGPRPDDVTLLLIRHRAAGRAAPPAPPGCPD